MPTAERILQLLQNYDGDPLTPQEIMDKLAIPVGEKREVRSILREMARGGAAGALPSRSVCRSNRS